MQLQCIMRGYNASNKDVRWSHSGFNANQVNKSAPVETGDNQGVPYAIWTIEITTSAANTGKKWASCKQQVECPLSTDFKFLIFKNYKKITKPWTQNVVYKYGYGGRAILDNTDLTQQVEDDIKRQISEHFSMPASSVTRSEDGQTFSITVF